jgi:hypothetical protein
LTGVAVWGSFEAGGMTIETLDARDDARRPESTRDTRYR